MTLQDKIDKLPLSIEYNNYDYDLFVESSLWGARVYYMCGITYKHLLTTECYEENIALSKALEDVIDRALTIIENKEWENGK